MARKKVIAAVFFLVCSAVFCAVPFADFLIGKYQIYPVITVLRDPLYNIFHEMPTYYLGDPSPIVLNIPQLLFAARQLLQFSWPSWDPYSGCGAPLIGAFTHGFFSPFNLMLLFYPAIKAFDYILFLNIWFAFLGVFFLGKKLGFSKLICFIGAGVYALSGPLTVPIFSLQVMRNNAVLFPWLIFILEVFISSPRFRNAFWAGLLGGLMIICGHPTVPVFYISVSILYVFLRMISMGISLSKDMLCKYSVIIFIGCLVSSIQLIPFYLFLKQCWVYKISAPYSFTKDFALHPISLLTMFIPMPFGALWGKGLQYWHTTLLTHNVPPGCFYMGIIPLLMLITGIKRDKYYLWIPMIVSLLVLLDIPFFNFTMYIPYIKIVYRWYLMPMPILFACLLAMNGLSMLFKSDNISKSILWSFWLGAIVGLVATGVVLFYSSHNLFLGYNGILYEQSSLFGRFKFLISGSDIMWSWMLLMLFGLVFFMKYVKNQKRIIMSVLFALITIDLWALSLKLIPRNIQINLEQPPAVVWLKKHMGNYRCTAVALSGRLFLGFLNNRVMPMRLNTLWNIRDVRQMDAIFPLRYYRFMHLIEGIQGYVHIFFTKYHDENRHLFNMIGTRYILVEKNDSYGMKQIRLFKTMDDIAIVFEDRAIIIFEDFRALQRAYFVTSTQSVQYGDLDEVEKILSKRDFNVYRNSVIECKNAITGGVIRLNDSAAKKLDNGSVQFLRDEPKYIKLMLKNEYPGFLILSDTYYKGWEAYVDKKKTTIYPANLMMRAVYIEEAGTHQVVFKY